MRRGLPPVVAVLTFAWVASGCRGATWTFTFSNLDVALNPSDKVSRTPVDCDRLESTRPKLVVNDGSRDVYSQLLKFDAANWDVFECKTAGKECDSVIRWSLRSQSAWVQKLEVDLAKKIFFHDGNDVGNTWIIHEDWLVKPTGSDLTLIIMKMTYASHLYLLYKDGALVDHFANRNWPVHFRWFRREKLPETDHYTMVMEKIQLTKSRADVGAFALPALMEAQMKQRPPDSPFDYNRSFKLFFFEEVKGAENKNNERLNVGIFVVSNDNGEVQSAELNEHLKKRLSKRAYDDKQTHIKPEAEYKNYLVLQNYKLAYLKLRHPTVGNSYCFFNSMGTYNTFEFIYQNFFGIDIGAIKGYGPLATYENLSIKIDLMLPSDNSVVFKGLYTPALNVFPLSVLNVHKVFIMVDQGFSQLNSHKLDNNYGGIVGQMNVKAQFSNSKWVYYLTDQNLNSPVKAVKFIDETEESKSPDKLPSTIAIKYGTGTLEVIKTQFEVAPPTHFQPPTGLKPAYFIGLLWLPHFDDVQKVQDALVINGGVFARYFAGFEFSRAVIHEKKTHDVLYLYRLGNEVGWSFMKESNCKKLSFSIDCPKSKFSSCGSNKKHDKDNFDVYELTSELKSHSDAPKAFYNYGIKKPKAEECQIEFKSDMKVIV